MKKSELKQLIKEIIIKEFSGKDTQRIKDLFTKSAGDDTKLLRLAGNMAKSITDPQKAYDRGVAAKDMLDEPELQNIFFNRAKELGLDPDTKQTKNSPSTNAKGTIFLPSYPALALWDHELTGQISDGYWENSTPHNHWQFWTSIDSKLGTPEVKITGGRPVKTGYGITNKDLLDVVGDRMITGARLAKALNKQISRDEYDMAEYFAPGMLGHSPTTSEEFIKAKNEYMQSGRIRDYEKTKLTKLNDNLVRKYFNTHYNEKDMMRDLKQIKLAMKNISYQR